MLPMPPNAQCGNGSISRYNGVTCPGFIAPKCTVSEPSAPMTYKVFLVEDEIVTREGIRDNVNWHAAGFAFCGEAPDGELALPLIQSLQPDLLITDIKMPFMDGLQLSKLVRELMPHVRIVILSGHDEFQYARAAISLGVSDYLLKPLGVRELEELLRRIGAQLDEERAQQRRRHALEEQAELDAGLRRDRFLLRLLTVGAPPVEALEEARALGYPMGATAYQVLLIRSEPIDKTTQDFGAQEQLHATLETLASTPHSGARRSDGSWLILRKDIDETVAVALGRADADTDHMIDDLLDAIAVQRHTATNFRIHVGRGSRQARLHQLNLSYAAALYSLHAAIRNEIGAEIEAVLGTENGDADHDRAESADRDEQLLPGSLQPSPLLAEGVLATPTSTLVTLHRAALADFLRTGLMRDFDAMFSGYMGALVVPEQSGDTLSSALDNTLENAQCNTLGSTLVEHYVRTDMALTIAKFVIQLGENPAHLFAELGSIAASGEPATIGALRTELREACAWALDLRDHRATSRNSALVQRAVQFIERHHGEASLSLAQVAAEVGMSPNHFSAVFSAETGENFRDHLSSLRIGRARELLRTTPMTNSEISDLVGYSDPHYFGAVFKRMTGLTPQQYRSQSVFDADQEMTQVSPVEAMIPGAPHHAS